MTESNVSRETEEQETEEATSPETETTETAAQTTESEEPAASETEETDTEDNENSGNDQIAEVRREAAGYRTKLRDTEAHLQRVQSELFHAKVAATGRLADASDMPVNVELLDDGDALNTAIDELLQSKPHLKARSFGGIGQGEQPERSSVSLGGILRRNA